MTLAEPHLVNARVDALLQMTQAIETAATLDELLLLALNEFTRLLGLPLGGVLLLDDERTHVRLASVFPPRVKTPPPTALVSAPVFQQLVEGRTPQYVVDLANAPDLGEIAALLEAERLHTLLLLPLVAQDVVIGVLLLASADSAVRLSSGVITLARVMAGQFAASIAAFRITEAAQRRSTELLTLSEIAATITSSLDPHEVYRLVQQKLNEHFNVEAGSLLMIDEDSGDLVFVMRLEGGEEQLSGWRVPKGQGIAGLVAQTRRYEIVRDAEHDPRIYRRVSEALGTVTRSLLCAPMLVKDRAIGVVQLLNKRDGEFTEEDGDRLTRMATTIGIAIENARLFQQVTNGRDRLEAILNSTTDGVLMVDLNGLVVTANPMAAQVLRMRREEIVGQELHVLLLSLHAQAREQPPVRPNGLTLTDVVELELSGHGPFRFVRYVLLPVRDAAGAEIGRLILFQDTTQAKELEQLREDYTGMLVHDLRAPLTAIMNGVLMVKRGLGGPVSTQQTELLSIAHQGTQTMLEMVNTLLDIAKMEQHSMTLDKELVAPASLFEEAQQRLRASLQGNSIKLEREIAPLLPHVEADRDKIVRVLQNLLDNAIKFSPTGRTVTVGASLFPRDIESLPLHVPRLPSSDALVLWVKDSGPGIPAQYHERIFEKFGQAGGRKARGTGLGLTFCKLTVEAHGGAIWLESSEGKGSTFAFTLPLDRLSQG